MPTEMYILINKHFSKSIIRILKDFTKYVLPTIIEIKPLIHYYLDVALDFHVL